MKTQRSYPWHRILFVLVMILYVVRVIFLRWHFWLIPFILWPGVVALTVLNYSMLNHIWKFLIVQCFVALSGVISSVAFTVRYVHIISDDPLAVVVGHLITILELIVIGLLTGVLMLVKYIKMRKK